MTERKLLRGKVAAILSDYELAISMGRNRGVKLGMEFAVLGDAGIFDPDGGETLGRYYYDKVRVQIQQVEENYSVATSRRADMTMTFVPSLSPFLTETGHKLTLDESPTPLDIDRNVRKGDVVEERR